MKEKTKKIGLILLFGCFILSFVCLVASCSMKNRKLKYDVVNNSATSETCDVASCSQQLNAYIYNSENETLTSTNQSPVKSFDPSNVPSWNRSAKFYNITICDLENVNQRNFGITCKYTNLNSLSGYKLVFVPSNQVIDQNNYTTWPSIDLTTIGSDISFVGQVTSINAVYNWSTTNVYLCRGSWYSLTEGVSFDNLNIFTFSDLTDFNNKRAFSQYGEFINTAKVEDDLQFEKELSYYNGYNDGLQLAENNLSSTIYSIFDAPFGILYEVLNFEILGVNLWLVVTGIFTLVLVIWVVKKFKQ